MVRFLFSVIFILGCSADDRAVPATDSGTADPDAPPPVVADATAFYSQFCAVFGGCCAGLGRTAHVDQCAALLASSSAGAYDPLQGGRCIGALRVAGAGVCADDFQVPAACGRAFAGTGTKKPGEACTSSVDCAPSADGDVSCARVGGTPTCRVQIVGKVGDAPCAGNFNGGYASDDGSGTTRDRVFVCDLTNGAFCNPMRTCTPRGAVGAACARMDPNECVADAYCDASRCLARKAIGAPCATAAECVRGSYCDGTCKAQKAADTPCTESAECRSFECSNTSKTCGGSGLTDFVCAR